MVLSAEKRAVPSVPAALVSLPGHDAEGHEPSAELSFCGFPFSICLPLHKQWKNALGFSSVPRGDTLHVGRCKL